MGVLNKLRGTSRPPASFATPSITTDDFKAGAASSSKFTASTPTSPVVAVGSDSPRTPPHGSPVLPFIKLDETTTVKPKSGILMNATPLSTLSYHENRQSVLFTSSTKRGSSAGDGIRSADAHHFGPLNLVSRAASHSELSSFDTQLPAAAERTHVRLVAPEETVQEKRVAYATPFDGSVVRRRQITTPTSIGSQESRANTAPSSPLRAVAAPVQPEYEYSRVYHSSNAHTKRRGLRAILAL